MITASPPASCAESTAALLDGDHWFAGLAPSQLPKLPALAAHLPLHGALAGKDLACAHVQRACDVLATVHETSDGRSGFVAVATACPPTAGRAQLLDAARRTWWSVHRPNAMIALPATPAGMGAIEDAVCEGINFYAGLVFTPAQIQAVRKAQRRGLARRLEQRRRIQRIAVAAALDLTAIDAAVNALLPPTAAALRDQAGPACARMAATDADGGAAFAVFTAFGGAPVQLLCGVEGETLFAPSDACLAAPSEAPRPVVTQLARHGIDLETIGNGLLEAALRQFGQSPSKLLALPVWPGTIAEFQEPHT